LVHVYDFFRLGISPLEENFKEDVDHDVGVPAASPGSLHHYLARVFVGRLPGVTGEQMYKLHLKFAVKPIPFTKFFKGIVIAFL